MQTDFRFRMFYPVQFSLILIFIISCNQRPDLVNKKSVTKSETITDQDLLSETPDAKQAYRLWHTIDQFELDQFDFFGEFYDDRLKFFYNDNPKLNIGNAQVKLLMLYFLDERLVKIRYHLDMDIENHLMDSLGIGLLNSKYTRRKRVLATDRSLKKLKDFNKSKNEPYEYEIAWDRHIILSTYAVNDYSNKRLSFDTISANYVYVDQLKSYKRRLMEIENNRITRLKNDSAQASSFLN
ncbi:MAG: hypothetical protein PVH48_09460 [Cyclobacteriaceae bacterium]